MENAKVQNNSEQKTVISWWPETLEDYVRRSLRDRFDSAKEASEMIDLIEQAKFYSLDDLAKEMITDLEIDDGPAWTLWQLHAKSKHEEERANSGEKLPWTRMFDNLNPLEFGYPADII